MTASSPAIESGLRIRRAGPSRPSPLVTVTIEELRHAVGIDDGHDAVREQEQVDDEHRLEEEGVQDEADEIGAIHAQPEPGDERDEQDRHAREPESPRVGTGIGMTEAREDQGEEGRREWRTVARWRLLRSLHRG